MSKTAIVSHRAVRPAQRLPMNSHGALRLHWRAMMRNETRPRTEVMPNMILVTSPFLECEAVRRARRRMTDTFVVHSVIIKNRSEVYEVYKSQLCDQDQKTLVQQYLLKC